MKRRTTDNGHPIRIAIVGVGRSAARHVLALRMMSAFYEAPPRPRVIALATGDMRRGRAVAQRLGIPECISFGDLLGRADIDAVIVASRNDRHFEQLTRLAALEQMLGIYVERPICTSPVELGRLTGLASERCWRSKHIQIGFENLQHAPVRLARQFVRKGLLGDPVHFHARYLQKSYLRQRDRERHQEHLRPTPCDGALVDLGSHVLSILLTLLDTDLQILSAASAGRFGDVPPECDLCTVVHLREPDSGAVGTATASRISCGCDDDLAFEYHGTEGAVRFTSRTPDVLEVSRNQGHAGWTQHWCGDDLGPHASFPGRCRAPGALVPTLHADYLFLRRVHSAEIPEADFVPTVRHGLDVQSMVQRIADALLY